MLKVGSQDLSSKGKSALLAAAYTGLEAEMYNYTDEEVSVVFHDFDKFLDTIKRSILMRKVL